MPIDEIDEDQLLDELRERREADLDALEAATIWDTESSLFW